jgi:CheY-like chemotaxis protein
MFQKILIVDESLALARMVESVLERRYPGSSVDVLYARSGMDAFARMEVCRPDLILLADSLTDLRPEAVCMRLLIDPTLSSVPVYLLNESGEADLLEDRYPNIRTVLPYALTEDLLAEILSNIIALPKLESDEGRQLLSYDPARAAFSGHTGFFKIQAALQMAHGDRLSGILRFFVKRAPIELYVSRGRFVFASTRNFVLYSRQSRAVLSQAALAEIMEAQEAQSVSGCPLFLYLSTRGLLPPEEVVPMVREHGHRLFSHLWTVGRVSFEFERTEYLPDFASKFPASAEDADNWVLSSLRYVQMDQLPAGMRIEPEGSPVFTRKGASLIERLRLTDVEGRFAACVNGAESLLSISKRTGIEMDEAQSIVFRLTTLGVMDYWAGQTLPGSALVRSAQVFQQHRVESFAHASVGDDDE